MTFETLAGYLQHKATCGLQPEELKYRCKCDHLIINHVNGKCQIACDCEDPEAVCTCGLDELRESILQPKDSTGKDRFLLNAYGRQCWDLGYEAGKRDSGKP